MVVVGAGLVVSSPISLNVSLTVEVHAANRTVIAINSRLILDTWRQSSSFLPRLSERSTNRGPDRKGPDRQTFPTRSRANGYARPRSFQAC